MESLFKTWKTSRHLYADFFDQYSLEQLNKVPTGFSNNLLWNIGHVIVAQQSLVYRLSGLPMHISDELFNRYKPGTRPTGEAPPAEAEQLRELLLSLVDRTLDDWTHGRFQTFTERQTATGFHLATLQDAFEFNNYHEGLHLGYMMCIRKGV
jgi:hypothetical protein